MLNKLVNKYINTNDKQAFTDIVKVCQNDLRGYCRRLTAGDLALADDIAQECLLTAYQQLGKLNNVSAFKSWLYRIAYRNFLQHKRKIKEQYLEDVSELIIINDNDNELLLTQLMAFLSEEQRAVLTLNSTLGYNHEEISNILEMPLGSVKSHGKRGKDKLITLLQTENKGVA